MNKSKKYTDLSFGTGIGSSSILVIFVILCLVSFATLSIVSANADFKLSTKVLDRSTVYYEATNQAEVSLARLDQTLRNIYHSSISKEEYFEAVGESKAFAIPISDLQTLEICVDILYPETATDSFYKIKSWQVVVTGDLDYNSTLNVIK